MYYEVYVDVLFVENLWINICLLTLTSKVLRIRSSRYRLLAGAAAGSLGSCLVEIGSADLTSTGCFLAAWLIAAVMIRITYKEKNMYIKCLIVLYLEGLLLGGVIRYLEQFFRIRAIWLAMISAVTAGFLLITEKVLLAVRRQREAVCPVVLYLGGISIRAEGLVDTGNSLRDPLSGRPVCVCEEKLLQTLSRRSGKTLLPRIVPYQTIGERGILKAYVLDRMEIITPHGTCIWDHPVLACMPLSSRQYRLILHQELLSPEEAT